MSDPTEDTDAAEDAQTRPVGTLVHRQLVSLELAMDALDTHGLMASVIDDTIRGIVAQALNAGGTPRWDSLSVKTARAMIDETDEQGNVIIPAGTLVILVRIQAVMPVGWVQP